MKIATLVYKKCLITRGTQNRIWSVLRRLLVNLLHDPECIITIHGKPLYLPLSHALPLYLNAHTFYDRLPTRIGEYVRSKYGIIKCIDVGANIGDTIAAFYKDEQDRFLAIEPIKTFYKYLLQNWGATKNIETLFCACGSQNRTISYKVLENAAGSAALARSENGTSIETLSLDHIVAHNPAFEDANILKIDTDGNDFDVINGAQNIIAANQPVTLFECYACTDTPHYVEDFLGTLNLFRNSGYNFFLLYDNFGYLMGKHSLDHTDDLRRLLFYQLTSNFCYFDVLLMKDEDIVPFYTSEIALFVDKMPIKSLQRTAKAAAQIS